KGSTGGAIGRSHAQAAQHYAHRTRAGSMKRHGHILLVDDDPNLRRLLALRIKSAGHEVSTAENAAAALKALREKVIDCVITDLLMDGMNGIDLLQHLSRERP